MWFDKADHRATFMDRRSERHERGPCSGYPSGMTVVVSPDTVADFTDIPFPDESFWHVVFDPPHCIGSTGRIKGINAQRYGLLFAGWQEMLQAGFAECFRVLKPHGTLIFKWNEQEISVSEILKLTPEKPLYGHRSGKQSKTHWIAFLKI